MLNICTSWTNILLLSSQLTHSGRALLIINQTFCGVLCPIWNPHLRKDVKVPYSGKFLLVQIFAMPLYRRRANRGWKISRGRRQDVVCRFEIAKISCYMVLHLRPEICSEGWIWKNHTLIQVSLVIKPVCLLLSQIGSTFHTELARHAGIFTQKAPAQGLGTLICNAVDCRSISISFKWFLDSTTRQWIAIWCTLARTGSKRGWRGIFFPAFPPPFRVHQGNYILVSDGESIGCDILSMFKHHSSELPSFTLADQKSCQHLSFGC